VKGPCLDSTDQQKALYSASVMCGCDDVDRCGWFQGTGRRPSLKDISPSHYFRRKQCGEM